MRLLILDFISDTVLRAGVAMLLIGVILVIMNRMFKKTQGPRSEQLQQKYAQLTWEQIRTLPDPALIEAVVANIMAKQDPQNPQPYYMLPMLSRGRAAVYSVWLVTCELKDNGFDGLFRGPSAPFCEPARDGFIMLGAEQCAQTIQDAMELHSSEDEMTGEHDLAVCHDRFLTAVAKEAPLARCVDYIRTNPNEFIDDPETAPAADDQQGE